jgi:hypothetical protein
MKTSKAARLRSHDLPHYLIKFSPFLLDHFVQMGNLRFCIWSEIIKFLIKDHWFLSLSEKITMGLGKLTLSIFNLISKAIIFLLHEHKIVHWLVRFIIRLGHFAESIRLRHQRHLRLHTLKSAPKSANIRFNHIGERHRKMYFFKFLNVCQNQIALLRDFFLFVWFRNRMWILCW